MKRTNWMSGLAVACALLLAMPSMADAEGATIKAKIFWKGKPYKGKVMKKMNKECVKFNEGTPPRSETVITNENKTLRNVFVYVKNAPEGDYPIPKNNVILDQVNCIYQPHVFGIRVGQTLEYRNSDPTAHNIHFTPDKNPELNRSQPKKGLIGKMTFDRAEVMVPVKCDVHPWMNAYVGVLDHPFFGTSGDDGIVTIEGLPPGNYELVAWHEKYGTQTKQVTVETNETKKVKFEYSRPPKKK